ASSRAALPQGRRVLAVTVEGTLPEASGGQAAPSPFRVVVVGDGDFASNSFFPYMSNSDLVLSMVRWLAREERAPKVGAGVPMTPLILLTGQQMQRIFLVLEGLLPLGVIARWGPWSGGAGGEASAPKPVAGDRRDGRTGVSPRHDRLGADTSHAEPRRLRGGRAHAGGARSDRPRRSRGVGPPMDLRQARGRVAPHDITREAHGRDGVTPRDVAQVHARGGACARHVARRVPARSARRVRP